MSLVPIVVRQLQAGQEPPLNLPGYVLRKVLRVQHDLDEVAAGGDGFHRLGVLKAAAHRMIVCMQ